LKFRKMKRKKINKRDTIVLIKALEKMGK